MPEMMNYTEICVREALENLLHASDICKCENCRLDIMAIALNSLPQKYVVTNKGTLYTKIMAFQQQYDADVITALANAMTVVSKNPRHDKE